ncbi:MAG TPA: ParM/StbA family protein [Anaerolineae bacterium]|nr:ParM/StbA family protein [Anaerolineae bacterium]
MNQTPTRVGIDVGFGDVKLVYHDPEPHTLNFPAVLGRAEERARLTLGLGGRRQHIQTVEYGGQAYFVGEGALIESRMGGAVQNAERIGSEEERVLLLAALARAGIDDVLVVTGLPVLWWERRRDLVRSWQGEHRLAVDGGQQTITVREVRPVWQPLGSFYARFLAGDGTAHAPEEVLRAGFGIVDIGFNTTDLSGIHNLQPIPRWSGGVRVGVRDALEVLSAGLEARYVVRRPLAELAAALRRGRPLTVYRDRVDLGELAKSALSSLAQEIVGEATRQWGQADRFHSVLITGGGAALVGKAVAAAFPRNAEILEQPALANALGFARFAQRRIFRADQG